MGSPIVGGETEGSVVELTGEIISGQLDDIGLVTQFYDDEWSILEGPSYGVASVDPITGLWTYDLDDSHPAVEALGVGETLTDVFVVLLIDETEDFGVHDITITITGVPCFCAGTMIDTLDGAKAIENIAVGESVLTENGFQPVLWVGNRHVSKAELRANPKLYPVRITAGSLGSGLPVRDLLVSRQHRMIVASEIAEFLTGTQEVLVAAIKLVGLPGIYEDRSVESVDYLHVLFENHEIVFAEGAPSESLLTGAEALASLDEDGREEILSLLPQVAELDHVPASARPIPIGKVQKRLVARHQSEQLPLLYAS